MKSIGGDPEEPSVEDKARRTVLAAMRIALERLLDKGIRIDAWIGGIPDRHRPMLACFLTSSCVSAEQIAARLGLADEVIEPVVAELYHLRLHIDLLRAKVQAVLGGTDPGR